MTSAKVICLVALALFGSAAAQPSKPAFWKGTPMDSMVEEMRSGCAEGSDPTACIKYKVMSLLDSIFKKDSFQVLNLKLCELNSLEFRVLYIILVTRFLTQSK